MPDFSVGVPLGYLQCAMKILPLALAALAALVSPSAAALILGALTAASDYPDSFAAIIAAHFDFRKHFEADLRARCEKKTKGT